MFRTSSPLAELNISPRGESLRLRSIPVAVTGAVGFGLVRQEAASGARTMLFQATGQAGHLSRTASARTQSGRLRMTQRITRFTLVRERRMPLAIQRPVLASGNQPMVEIHGRN